MTTLLEHMRTARVVPVLRSATAAEAVSTARDLADGGMTVIELTYSTPNVLTAIQELAADPMIVVGAGTVLSEQQAHDAVDAGVQFLVSPVWLPWLPNLARDRGVASIPGAATPSEIWAAHSLGATAVKVFPIARLGGAAYIRDLLAPLPGLTLMATGGVDLTSAAQLLHAGCIAVGLGVGKITTGPGDSTCATTERARRFLAALGPA